MIFRIYLAFKFQIIPGRLGSRFHSSNLLSFDRIFQGLAITGGLQSFTIDNCGLSLDTLYKAESSPLAKNYSLVKSSWWIALSEILWIGQFKGGGVFSFTIIYA